MSRSSDSASANGQNNSNRPQKWAKKLAEACGRVFSLAMASNTSLAIRCMASLTQTLNAVRTPQQVLNVMRALNAAMRSCRRIHYSKHSAPVRRPWRPHTASRRVRTRRSALAAVERVKAAPEKRRLADIINKNVAYNRPQCRQRCGIF